MKIQLLLREIEQAGHITQWRDSYKRNHQVEFVDKCRCGNRVVYFFRGEGWFHYSRRFGARYRQFAYLVGGDDNGRFVRRVNASCKTIQEALNWLIPAAIQKAIKEKKKVVRQGDVYLVESVRDDLTKLPSSHTFDESSRCLLHNGGHAPYYFPYFIKAYQQRNLGFSTSNKD